LLKRLNNALSTSSIPTGEMNKSLGVAEYPVGSGGTENKLFWYRDAV